MAVNETDLLDVVAPDLRTYFFDHFLDHFAIDYFLHRYFFYYLNLFYHFFDRRLHSSCFHLFL